MISTKDEDRATKGEYRLASAIVTLNREHSPTKTQHEEHNHHHHHHHDHNHDHDYNHDHNHDREQETHSDTNRDRRDWNNLPPRDAQKFETFLEHRRKLRDQTEVSPVWERSPTPPSPNRKQRTKDYKSEESKKKVNKDEFGRDFRKSKQKIKDLSSPNESNSDASDPSSSESDSSDQSPSRKKRKHHSTSKHKKSQRSKKSRSNSSENEERNNRLWVEKKSASERTTELSTTPVGPTPLPQVQAGSYGGQLLPGEGDAIAQFVQQNKRIPRRGEIGLTSNEIDKYENSGYVMSGSRHKRMTAVRIRKENQVYTAEEKRSLTMANFEEKVKKENKIIADFREILHSKFGKQTGP